jgi:beta-glucosidase
MAAHDFRWIVGIENAFIPDMDVDELTWTGHRERWRGDLALAAEVGADAVRYGLTWPEVETAPGHYDWSAVDEVVAEFERLGLEPIWDLVHFGVPAHLEGGFLDAAFPDAFAAYAAAFAGRYRGRVRKLTPLNEPYISTFFRAGKGIWPPYLQGDEGFARLLHPIVVGLRKAIRAIDAVAPDTEIWLNDGADTFHTDEPALREQAAFRTLQRYAAFDLLLGGPDAHETHAWLARAGFPTDDLVAEPVRVDVIGLDYYPETEHELSLGDDGAVAQRPAAPARRAGLRAACRAFHARYGRPIFVAESSASGDDATRRDWIDWNLRELRGAHDDGVPVVGYTWWPLFDHVDWDTLLTRLTGSICPAGLYHLRPTTADRAPTDAVAAFREAAALGFPGGPARGSLEGAA